MAAPKNLFLNIARDPQGRIWGIARICMADGSCLVVESRIYKSQASDGVLGGEEEDEEPAKNQALDEALDKLCKITHNQNIMRAIPLPARLALRAVCTARNIVKIKRAAEEEGDDELAGKMHARLRRMKKGSPVEQRAHDAMRLWQ